MRHCTKNLDYILRKTQFFTDLKDDWDGDGAVKISKNTYKKFIDFLYELYYHSNRLVEFCKIDPTISPVPDGSIDLLGKTERFQLLINIRENELSSYYGSTTGGFSVSATFKPELQCKHISKVIESLFTFNE